MKAEKTGENTAAEDSLSFDFFMQFPPFFSHSSHYSPESLSADALFVI